MRDRMVRVGLGGLRKQSRWVEPRGGRCEKGDEGDCVDTILEKTGNWIRCETERDGE